MKEAQVKVDKKTPLFEISWQEDLALRMDPPLVTQYMRDQIPVLEFVDWKVTSAHPGEVETVLPLNPPSTNQHFTHQAALIALSADYSGGTALATLFWGWPVGLASGHRAALVRAGHGTALVPLYVGEAHPLPAKEGEGQGAYPPQGRGSPVPLEGRPSCAAS